MFEPISRTALKGLLCAAAVTIGIGGAAYGVDWSLAYVDTSEDTDGSDATAVFTIAKSF